MGTDDDMQVGRLQGDRALAHAQFLLDSESESEAETAFAQALDLFRAREPQNGEAAAECILGRARSLARLGRQSEAIDLCQEAGRLFGELGIAAKAAHALALAASLLSDQARYAEAARAYEMACDQYGVAAEHRQASACVADGAECLRKAGDTPNALAWFAAAGEICVAEGWSDILARSLSGTGRSMAGEGRHEEAVFHYAIACTMIPRDEVLGRELAECLCDAATSLRTLGRPTEAESRLDEAHSILQELVDGLSEAPAGVIDEIFADEYVALGRCCALQEDPQGALDAYRRAHDLYSPHRTRNQSALMRCLLGSAEALQMMGRDAEAAELMAEVAAARGRAS